LRFSFGKPLSFGVPTSTPAAIASVQDLGLLEKCGQGVFKKPQQNVGEKDMWLFSEHGFLSVVKHKFIPGHVMVRARVKEDAEDLVARLAKLGERTEVKETPDGDYRFRITCTKKNMARVVTGLIEEMGYTNFKDRVHENGEPDRDRAYMGVWSEMNHLQSKRQNPGEGSNELYWFGQEPEDNH
jgi:hypothetical protein